MFILDLTVGKVRSKINRLLPASNSSVKIDVTDTTRQKSAHVEAYREYLGFRSVLSIGAQAAGREALVIFRCNNLLDRFSLSAVIPSVLDYRWQTKRSGDHIPTLTDLPIATLHENDRNLLDFLLSRFKSFVRPPE